MSYMVITYHDDAEGAYTYRFGNPNDAHEFLVENSSERYQRYVEGNGVEDASIRIDNGIYAHVYSKTHNVNWYWEFVDAKGFD